MAEQYWIDCIGGAMDEAGLTPTSQQVEDVAECVEVSFENYGLSHGHECIPNPLQQENDVMKYNLKRKKDKAICTTCMGRGSVTESFGIRSSTSSCFTCRGGGYIYNMPAEGGG